MSECRFSLELSRNRLPHPCKGEGRVRVEGGRRPATERSSKPRRDGGSGWAAHLDLADVLLLAVRVHVLPQSARVGESLATVVEGAQVRLQLARPPPGGVLWALVGDPLAERDLSRQRLLYDSPIVPVTRVRNIVVLLTLVLWRAGASWK